MSRPDYQQRGAQRFDTDAIFVLKPKQERKRRPINS